MGPPGKHGVAMDQPAMQRRRIAMQTLQEQARARHCAPIRLRNRKRRNHRRRFVPCGPLSYGCGDMLPDSET